MARKYPQGSNSYGKKHREAKQKRLSRIDNDTCEFSSRDIKNNGEMHHVVTRLHGGPDHESNYRWLNGNIHQKFIHGLCNVDDPESVRSRVILSRALFKHILDDKKRNEYHEKIRDIDSLLINGYIENMLLNLPDWLRDNVLFQTLVSNFETVRDLTIENLYKDAVIEELRKKLKDAGIIDDIYRRG